ncbi:MAG: DNA-processing protein DprA [Planctomycetota bacterium]
MTEPMLEEDEWLPWLRLWRAAGIGQVRGLDLLQRYGSPEAILGQTQDELVGGAKLPREVAAGIARGCSLDVARAELARLRKLRVRLVNLHSSQYPALLREMPHAPILLARLGPLADPGQRAIAVVGSRQAGARAQRIAYDFARAFAAEGVTVVSGLAKGVDRAAHEGALSVPNGRTIAVLGNGLARVYPTEHTRLATRIREGGALWSELPPDEPPNRWNFPERNRIIAGAALGVVVIAARERSGALITARHAVDIGRETFTIPGTLDDVFSRGSNHLLKAGNAHFVEGPSEVLEKLQFTQPKPNVELRPALYAGDPRVSREPLPGVPGEVARYLEAEARICTFDEIVFSNRIDARAAISALGFLACKRRVKEVPGVGYLAVV